MRLPKFALVNYHFVFILVLLSLLVGVSSYITMPRSEDPELSLPNYTVSVVYPGTSPEDMEELVVDPVEEAIDRLDNIVEIYTTITEGLAVIEVEGEFGIDYDDQFDEIQSEINTLRPGLPKNIRSIEVEQFKPEDRTNIMQLALVSETASYGVLNDVAEELQDELERIPGLQSVKIEASPEEQVRVDVDPQRMAQYNIPLEKVIDAIQTDNANIPGGALRAGDRSLTVKTSGSFDGLDEMERTVIATNGSTNLYLEDIADIQKTVEEIRWIGRFNGERAVFLLITRKAGVNLVSLTESIHRDLERLRPAIPDGMSLDVAFEQAPSVTGRVNGFFMNLLQGMVLVGVVIFLFLGARSSFVVMTIIPIAIIVTVGLLDIYGYGLQQISIASLVIALGLLVDNGIVVTENIVRYRKKGYGPLEAAAKGTSEVGYAIFSSTVTTVLAFAPLAFMQSGPGEFLRSLPVTVITALVVSLILALVLNPILSGKILKKEQNGNRGWSLVDRALTAIVSRVYEPSLNFALQHGVSVISGALLLLAGAGMLFPYIGVSFFPTADKPMLLIEVDAPDGVTIDRTDHAVRYVESVLDTTDYVTSYVSNTGHGNPQVYYNRIPEQYKKQHGQVLVNFREWKPELFYRTLGTFRKAFERYPGAVISFRELKNGAPFKSPVEIRIIGENIDTLRALSREVEKIISATGGTKDVQNPLAVDKTDLKVEINRNKAGMLQVPVAGIDRAVRAGVDGLEITETTLDLNERYPVLVRLSSGVNAVISDLSRIYVSAHSGGQVPLNQLVRIRFDRSVSELLHYNLERSTSVTSNVVNPDSTGAITRSIITRLDGMDWPEGHRYYVAGEYETQQESFGDLGRLLAISLIAIFAVLVLQFRSLRQPLIIFSAIPLAVTGSFFALYLTGWSFSFFAFVGLISLVGIVVNNSIILVDFTNLLRSRGMALREAILAASRIRFVPIVLTATTTIVGLLPLTLSNTSLWSPLGWTIIGGMISSTFLTLVIVPVLYRWFSRG